ncbi:CBS domain-containing protein [candidate division KSB3 bacterium]|jgi:CBS-domain-containing membrane protein|uniref:CBS domain-containing protein n=1 Tax=candidate division KSB3 bacterium TaxID=2044937 RepID=A0A9D5Q8X5_9BACT|nr:CBS domain-containing protein [candidate division KSB3 bacterium]MBD3327301.1 CBS domain-containing protein [candidate division KSB3 bacterium]
MNAEKSPSIGRNIVEVLSNVQAKDVMTRQVICVYPKTSIKELSAIFIEHVISGAPVVDDDQHVIGFVSQIDIVELDLYSNDYLDSRLEETGGYVQDIMTSVDTFAHETDPLTTVIEKMCTDKLHRIVVLDDQDHVAGIITTMDVMCYLQQVYQASS